MSCNSFASDRTANWGFDQSNAEHLQREQPPISPGAAAGPHLADLLRGLELNGARPGELAGATVVDFNRASLRLTHRKGRPPKLRTRYVTLSTNRVRFFRAQMKRKLPAAPILTEDGVQPWRRHRWARAISTLITEHNRRARGKQRVPTSASAYSFRHSRISKLLQLHGNDPLTVAHQTGTSLAMIEKAYFRFIPSAMKDKLEAARKARWNRTLDQPGRVGQGSQIGMLDSCGPPWGRSGGTDGIRAARHCGVSRGVSGRGRQNRALTARKPGGFA